MEPTGLFSKGAGAAVVGAMFLAACGGAQTAESPKAPAQLPIRVKPAEVRFMHASATAPKVDFWVANKSVTTLDSGTFTPVRLEIGPGNPELDVRTAGTSAQPLVEAHPTFEAGHSYTVVLVGDPNSTVRGQMLQTLVLEDAFPARPEPGRSLVRFTHAVPGGANFTIADPTNHVFYNDLGFGQTSAFGPGPAQTQKARLMVSGREIFASDIPYAALRAFTVVVMPTADTYRYLVASDRLER
mgnify:CR=1 FL=1